jgi:hypothetical protein
MKLSIEVNEGVWKEVDVGAASVDEDGELEFGERVVVTALDAFGKEVELEFVERVVVTALNAFGEEVELEVVRFDPKNGQCDLFGFEIGGLDTVPAKEIK